MKHKTINELREKKELSQGNKYYEQNNLMESRK